MRSLKEIFFQISEDETLDKKIRQEASIFYTKFINYIRNNLDEVFSDPVYVESQPALRVRAKNIDSKYKELVILLARTRKKLRGGFGVQENESFIFLPILTDRTSFLRAVEKEKSTFIHEFIHFLDQRRWKSGRAGFKAGASSISGNSNESYFNHPLEFNAYYQQSVSELIRSVSRALKNKRSQHIRYYIPNSVKQFIKNVKNTFFRADFVKSLNPKFSRKLDKRLAGLYIRLYKARKNYENKRLSI